MTRKQQLEIYKELDEKLIQISGSKGNDYAKGIGAGEGDVLSNFKEVSGAAKLLGIDIGKPDQYALFMVLLKIARITNISNSDKIVNHEGLEDTWQDLINYGKLGYCCYKENEIPKNAAIGYSSIGGSTGVCNDFKIDSFREHGR